MKQQNVHVINNILVINHHLIVEGLNATASKKFDYFPQSDRKIHCYKLLHDSDRPCKFCKIQRIKSGLDSGFTYVFTRNNSRFECCLSRLDGHSNTVKFIYLIKENDSMQDLAHALKEDESLVNKQDQKFYYIFTQSPSPIGIIDKNMNLTDYNQAVCELFGYTEEEIKDKNIIELVAPEERIRIAETKQKLDQDGILRNFEIKLLKKNQDTFYGSFSAHVVYDNHHVPLHYISLLQDISKNKKIEIELLKAKQRAEEADRLKTAFLTNMSHEIRTPMNAIIGFSELLSNPEITQEEISNYTKIIKNRCSHLLQIVNDILDISKIEANQIELKEVPVKLNHLFEDLYRYYAQKIIDEKKFKIILNVEKPMDDHCSNIMVDELRLRQIIGNLLDNAVKFTREGKIEFGYRFIEDKVLIYISDTGIGISEEMHENIFERFSQIDTSLVRQFGGNGLGLAICKAFVELMGGQIWLESKIDEGSTFLFTLPLRKSNNEIKPDTIHPEFKHLSWKNKRVLIVEDDKSSAKFMNELLKLTRVEIVTAFTAKEALEIFTSNQSFNLVLMDIQLPDRNGLELTRLFKGFNKTVPIIAQTAYAMEGDNIKCIQAGCDDYISKPLNISDLFSKLGKLLST